MNGGARTIVITGGGSGIGRAVALLCAERGDNVAILDNDEKSASKPPRKRLRAAQKAQLASFVTSQMSLKSSAPSPRCKRRLGRLTAFSRTPASILAA